MISGRTFAREMIALRQRETKRAGRILALQGQNPGQLELRTHSEFGANLSVTPGGFAFLCLRAIPRRSSPAGYHSLRLRPAKTKPQYLLLHPAMPNPRDERLIYTPHHPVRWPYRRRPAQPPYPLNQALSSKAIFFGAGTVESGIPIGR